MNAGSLLPRLLASFATLAAASSALGQAVTDDDGPVRLSEFRVESVKDRGYVVANSVTATGIATEIRNVPMAINVVTEDFIRDSASFDLKDAVSFAPNVNSNARDPMKINVRGFAALILQDGYARSDASSSTAFSADFIDRIEVIKGPSAVFHGLVSPGGVINYLTKRPQAQAQTTLRATYGSEDFRKVSLDSTGAVTRDGSLKYRVFGSYLDRNDWVDFAYARESTTAAAFTWEPWRNVSWTVTGQLYHRKENPRSFASSSHPLFLFNPDVPNTASVDNYIPSVLGPNAPQITEYVPQIFPNGFAANPNGPDAFIDLDRGNVLSDLQVRLSDRITFRSGVDYFEQERETLTMNAYRPRSDGSFQERFTNGISRENQFNTENELAAVFDTGSLRQKVLAGFEYRYFERKGKPGRNGPILRWYPSDPPRRALEELAGVAPFVSGWPRGASYARAFYLSDQITAFDERLHVLLGARHMSTADVPHDINGNRLSAQELKAKKTTPQAGVVFSLTPQVNAFANYSKSFRPNNAIDVEGNVAPPQQGKGYEAGIKADALDGRLSGSVSIYQVTLASIARRDFQRELETGLNPWYVLGGTQRSEGAELDLTYSPGANFSVLFNYSYMWEARTIKDVQEPNQVGIRMENTPKHAASLWSKYSWTEGSWNGLALGGGARYVDEVRPQERWQTGTINPSYVKADFFVSYTTRRFGPATTFALNVNNVFDKYYYYGSFQPGDPRAFYLSVETRF